MFDLGLDIVDELSVVDVGQSIDASADPPQLDASWEVIDAHHLRRVYTFRNFAEALEFANRVGEMAEEQAHHPDLHIAWGKVGVEIWTHKIKGLTESDFVFAAKADRLKAGE